MHYKLIDRSIIQLQFRFLFEETKNHCLKSATVNFFNQKRKVQLIFRAELVSWLPGIKQIMFVSFEREMIQMTRIASVEENSVSFN